MKLQDQKMNLFDFVAYLRWQRPYLVCMMSQYKFCYKVWNILQQPNENLDMF